MKSPPPVIVTGMHRSGTAMVAGLGVDMGADLLRADPNNPHGYWEDAQVLEFQRQLLVDATRSGEAGHADWGWTESEYLDRRKIGRARRRARKLVGGRRRPGSVWGWKDPRTTLLLDLWDKACGPATHIFVYRHPLAVAASIARLGAGPFPEHPDYAERIWRFYNRAFLDYADRHGGSSLVVHSGSVAADPERFAEVGGSFLGAPAQPLSTIVDSKLLRSPPAADAAPESREIYDRLEALADIPGP